MVEMEIGVLCEQCLTDRIPDAETLRREITAWETAWTEQRATINWQFTMMRGIVKCCGSALLARIPGVHTVDKTLTSLLPKLAFAAHLET